MNIYTLLLFFILKFSGICIYAYHEKRLLIEITIPKELRKFVEEERVRGGLDVFHVVHKDQVLQIKAAVTKETIDVLNEAKISYEVLESDLLFLTSHRRSLLDDNVPGIINNKPTFLRDLQYEEIIQYLDYISQKSTYYRKISVETIGQSYQDRDIRLVKIEHPYTNNIMFFDAGTHSREWLSITTALYLVSSLIDADDTSFINNMNWYIVPLVNPDGYVYSYSEDRLHRKNTNFTSSPRYCHMRGIDLNRNYAYKWGVAIQHLTDLCGETYPGMHAFSEKETQALSRTLKKYTENIKLYVALHTYGCVILYPWGYQEKPCDDALDLIDAAQVAVDAMNLIKNTDIKCKWEVHNAGTMPGGGAADDYAKGSLRIKYSYTIELQGSEIIGFDYNRSLIHLWANQSYAGITTLANYVNNKYNRVPVLLRKRSAGWIIKAANPLQYIVLLNWITKSF